MGEEIARGQSEAWEPEGKGLQAEAERQNASHGT